MFKFCITRRNRVVKVWHLFTVLQEQEIKLLKIPSDVIKTSEKKKTLMVITGSTRNFSKVN